MLENQQQWILDTVLELAKVGEANATNIENSKKEIDELKSLYGRVQDLENKSENYDRRIEAFDDTNRIEADRKFQIEHTRNFYMPSWLQIFFALCGITFTGLSVFMSYWVFVHTGQIHR